MNSRHIRATTRPSADDSPLRVIFVFDNLEFSGAGKVALDIVRATKNGPELGIVASGFVCMADATGGSCASDDIGFANPHATVDLPIWRKVILGVRAIFRCAQASRDADLLVGVTPPAAFAAKCASWLAGKPVVAWVHYDIEGWQRELIHYSRSGTARFFEVLFYKWIVPRFSSAIFVSEACRSSMARIRGGAGTHWTSIPNLFSASSFSTQEADLTELRQLKAGGIPVLLFLGRLSRQKRWQDTVRVMEILAQRNCPAHLVVIGDGVERQAFLDRLAASSAKSRITWLGQLANPIQALLLADALILTSLYEAWPVVILEAFHCQLPVVSYCCPSGPAQMLADGRGICCEETPEAMANAVAELFSISIDERTTMLRAASSFNEQHRASVIMPMWKAYVRTLVDHH